MVSLCISLQWFRAELRVQVVPGSNPGNPGDLGRAVKRISPQAWLVKELTKVSSGTVPSD